METLYGGQITLSTQLIKPNYILFTAEILATLQGLLKYNSIFYHSKSNKARNMQNKAIKICEIKKYISDRIPKNIQADLDNSIHVTGDFFLRKGAAERQQLVELS